jgi:RNA-directed DNA polymerase
LILVSGDRQHAEQACETVAAVLAPMGLRLSAAKTLITSIDEGLDFLGWRIQRHRKPGTSQRYVYTYPAKKALRAVMAKVKTISRQNNNEPLAVLLRQLNPVLHGWAAYFRFGVSSATFQYLSKYAWERVVRWIRRKHRKITWKQLRRRYCGGRWSPADGNTTLFDPGKMRTIRYRYRGTKIPTPWTATI